jgi:hypothetical protein
MPLPTRRSSLAAVLAVTALQGCVLSEVLPSVIESPQIQVRAVQVLPTGLGGATLRLELAGYNPNAFALYASGVRADLWVNGRVVGALDAGFTQVMQARRPLVLLVDARVERAGGAGAALGFVPGVGASVPFRVEGELRVGSRYGESRARFFFEGAVPASVFAGWR